MPAITSQELVAKAKSRREARRLDGTIAHITPTESPRTGAPRHTQVGSSVSKWDAALVAPDQRSDASVGEELCDHRMRRASVQNVDARDTALDRPQDALGLCDHPPSNRSVCNLLAQLGCR